MWAGAEPIGATASSAERSCDVQRFHSYRGSANGQFDGTLCGGRFPFATEAVM